MRRSICVRCIDGLVQNKKLKILKFISANNRLDSNSLLNKQHNFLRRRWLFFWRWKYSTLSLQKLHERLAHEMGRLDFSYLAPYSELTLYHIYCLRCTIRVRFLAWSANNFYIISSHMYTILILCTFNILTEYLNLSYCIVL